MSTEVSFYKNHSDTAGEIRSLLGLCEDIKQGKWDRDILAMRQELEGVSDEKKRDCIKKLHKAKLSAFTGSGVFSERNAKGLIKHSGIIFIDIDLKDNPILLEKFNKILKHLTADKYTHILFISCGGKGIVIGVKIDGTKHKETFQFLEHYYLEKHGLTIDKGCKDITRLRYISYDPDLYLCEGAETVIVPPDFMKEAKCRHTTPASHANGKNHEIIKAIIANGKLLGDDTYESWIKIAFALVGEFGEAGRDYFHELSRISPKYDRAACDAKFDNCLKTNKGAVTFASIVHLAKNTPEWSPDKVDKVDVLSNDENEVDTLEEITESILPITSFPMDVFPERFRETIKKLSVSFNIDSEVSASIALSVITAAVGNTVRVSPKRGWDVPLFVWMIVIAASGYGKTHPISRLVKPIDRKQAKAYRKYQELMAVYNTKMGIYRKKKEAELPTKPTLEQFKVSDTTIEALADVFEGQPRGVLIHQDELSGLVLSMNQYKNGKGSDRQHILELFNCDPWKIDRKSGSKYIPNTGASIVGGLQPQIMPKIFDQDSFNDGLLPRFLFVNAGSKPQHFSRIGISDADFVYWYDLITFCLDIPLTQNSEGYVEPKFLILSDDALNLWESFFNEYHELASFLPNRVKVFVPKLITYSLKLTGILHILKSFELKNISNVISEDTISDAIKLTNFYAGQVMVLVKQYNKPTKEFNEYENRIIQTLNKLQGQVENGKLPLSRIAEEINCMLPERLRIKDNKNIGAILRRLNLTTKQSTGGFYFLLWEEEKIKNLLRDTSTMSTMSTLSTQKEIPEVEFVEEVSNV